MTTVVVQAGHVARKVGSTGTNGEQPYNLAVTRLLVAELKRRGVTARWIDADEAGSRYKGDYFVAVHADGSTSKQAEGSSVGYRNSRGKTLAQKIKTNYQARAKQAGYPIRFRADNYTTALGRYYGTGYAIDQNPACRAVIVEGGFLTNPTERKFLQTLPGQRALALAIADAIIAAPVKPPVKKPAPKPPAKPKPQVSLSRVAEAFAKRQDDVSNDTEQVQRALNARYPKRKPVRVDGIVDDPTVAAYKAHQVALYGKGPDADGKPGRDSLSKLGFRVTK